MADRIDASRCKVCNKTEGVMACSRCKDEFYCSRQHQVSDWKNHKELCSQLNPPKDGETLHVTGILLPADKEQPCFIKIKCTIEVDEACETRFCSYTEIPSSSPVNKCVQRITNYKAPVPWAGNILVMKHDRSNLMYKSI